MTQNMNETETALYRYRARYERRDRLSRCLAEKTAGLFHGNRTGLPGLMDSMGVFLLGMFATASEKLEMHRTRKKLCGILNCLSTDVAMDLDELNGTDRKARYYGDDLTYGAEVRKESLSSLRDIWGDAHLEALDEMSCLNQLRNVWGSLYVSRCADLEGLNIRIIRGDLHGEKLANPHGLQGLVYVGGKIFYQDRCYASLEEFRKAVDWSVQEAASSIC